MTPDPDKITLRLTPTPVTGWSWQSRREALIRCLECVYRCRVTTLADEPAGLLLALQPAEVEGWPWYTRLRQMLKSVGRMYRCRAEIVDEVFPPATEPASSSQKEAT